MSNYFIIHAHWHNRGDEAALRALLDELQMRDHNAKITVQFNTRELNDIKNIENESVYVLRNRFPQNKDLLEYCVIYITKGKLALTEAGNNFISTIKNCDVLIHAPGGPSIGDIYANAERPYLLRLLLAKRMNKPYFIYAPSMGPFRNSQRNKVRKYLLKNAVGITLREDISAKYLKELLPKVNYKVTVDSAFQHPVHVEKNETLLIHDSELTNFLKYYNKIIGITITDLQWNPRYIGNNEIKSNIKTVFTKFIQYLGEQGFGIVFIPQLFGTGNDRTYMDSFSSKHTFTVKDTYDCYFQQYLISKLYAVVGMRYHSNIFSCKMKVPFVSISYEQKMKGFMENERLTEYCLDVQNLSYKALIQKFEYLLINYDNYKNILSDKSTILVEKSKLTTNILLATVAKE